MLAAIDVGSNTVRLLVGEVDNGKLLPHTYYREITRLRGGMIETEGLAPDARERTLSVLQEFAVACRTQGVRQIRAVATAACRQACNGHEFVAEIQKRTGLPLHIISGKEEAALTAAGVMSALDPTPESALLIDVGGGSTEFVLQSKGRAVWSTSQSLGVVHLTEECADQKERLQCIGRVLCTVRSELEQVCRKWRLRIFDLLLVGTAGTVTTLAALDLRMQNYDWQKINNHRMSGRSITHLYEELQPLTVAEREALPGMEPGRGDLIIAGIEIVHETMKMLSAQSLVVSDFGILEGCLLSLENDNYPPV